MTTSPRLGLTDLEEAQAVPPQVVNENERRLEQMGNFAIVKDKDLATPPGSPAEGDAYIIASSPTGAWATIGAGNIAFYMNGSWEGITPIEGTRAYIQDENIVYEYSGSAWVSFGTGSRWVLAGSGQTATGVWDFAVDGAKANVDFTGLSSYNELLIIIDAVTGSAGTANRTIRFSTDNGSSFYSSSGDYVEIAAAGTVTSRNAATFQGGTTAASSAELMLTNMKGAIKRYSSSSTVAKGLFRASANDINAVRITSTTADTLNGGKIYVYGR